MGDHRCKYCRLR
ncbi:unnamed protein product [Linum tenue]|uniref:Uncharacterized protein n=1 Tax=Linum tenue TaxID=586396 RepID=A0AAV0HPD4_9ROSI|nr:unnamed protein product [Linum tenue]